MADQSSAQERTQEPTAKRLADARKKGDIARSRELNTVVMLLASVLGLLLFGDNISESLRSIIVYDLQYDRSRVFSSSSVIDGFKISIIFALKAVSPFLLLMFVAVFLGPISMGGISINFQSITPKISKLNPISGFKRMFGIQGLVELLKAVLKVALVGIVAVILLGTLESRYLSLGQLPLLKGVHSGIQLLGQVFTVLTLSLLVVVLIDVPFQKWNYKRKLKMTLQEVKDENKETNGNPQLKSRIRGMQIEVANRRMLQAVPEADVVIVNPTHFSVALRYDQEKQGAAPQVVAKGIDHMALKIREIAKANQVSIFEAPPLARALYHHTKLEEEIPEELFLAVAQVLAYVYQIKQQATGTTGFAEKPIDLPIPENFRHDG